EAELRRYAADVHVGAARLRGLGVELSDVQVGPLHAERTQVGIDRRHVLLSNVRVRQFVAVELALDFAQGRLKRAAFSGGELLGVAGLAGVAVREGDHFTVRVARPGLLLSGHLGAASDAHLELERLPLAPLLPEGLQGGRASGTLDLARVGSRWQARGKLDVEELAVEHRAVAGRRLEHLHPSVEGELTYENGRLTTGGLELRLAPLAVTLSGELGHDFELAAAIRPLHCAEALAALRPVVPSLDGMLLDGELGGTIRASGTGRRLDELVFDL